MSSDEPTALGPLATVALNVSVELGRCAMSIAEIMQLSEGAIVALDSPVGAPVDVIVNGRQIGRGELIAVDDHYGVRITHLAGET